VKAMLQKALPQKGFPLQSGLNGKEQSSAVESKHKKKQPLKKSCFYIFIK